MMISVPLFELTLAAVIVLLLLYKLALCIRTKARLLPPGPPADPVIGHLRHMPTSGAPDVFHAWAQTYGEVMSLQLLNKTIIILDTHRAAVELLEKQSAKFSSRPLDPLRLYELSVLFNLIPLPKSSSYLQHGLD
ncbi:Cytochrome P450 [Mycena chlorophos]|uniref:Cytochrome P450 n=1 Tax=Mycena chlorophos TaxID=658473 RepID=A0A8H6WEY4_MYCCL|nr:Cytochrome P450 [Mycena chlorophos]